MAETDVKITYETIYEIFRSEKVRDELQKLDPNFIEDVKKYLWEKNSILKSQIGKKSIFSSTEVQKTIKQIENIKKILKELQEKREAKIIKLAIFNSRTGYEIKELSRMLEKEKDFFNDLVKLLKNNQNSLFGAIDEDIVKPKGLKKKVKSESKKVGFKEDVQEFVGADLQVYGPYKTNDTAELPIKIAELLIKKDKATEK